MKISVITICRNEVDTIEETILSVINQSYENIEYIVVDGQSTDGTLDIIEKYKDKITHFISEPDTGIYNAMNKGVKLATGDFLNFMNASDAFANENVIKNVVETLKQNPECELSFGDAYYINKETNKIITHDYEAFYKKYYFFLERNLCHQSMFYKKTLFEKYGLYNENFTIAADTNKNMSLILKHHIKTLYIPEILVHFHLGGFSSNQKMKKIMDKEKRQNYKEFYASNYYIHFFLKYIRFFTPKFYVWISERKVFKKYQELTTLYIKRAETDF